MQARMMLLLLIAAQAAVAEIPDSSENGFTTIHEVEIDAPRAAVYAAAVDDIGNWWSDDHTISGDAGRMSIDAVVQGCFCEMLGDKAGIVHLTVTFANPGVLLRMTGALGPLGVTGVNGNMLWEFADSGAATTVRFTYVVGGYRPGGLEEIAPAVDFVIGEALARLQAYVETGDADTLD
ncbi:MAG: SRPBCC family protein [Woeseiaceae bacterium]